MTDFDLDLRTVEEQIEDDETSGAPEGTDRIELGVLDGSTSPGEWIGAVEDGRALVLAVEGDVNELAAAFARDVKEMGAELVHFRGFLVVAPPGVAVDTDRL